MKSRKCLECDAPFTPRKGGRPQKFCSPECKNRAKNRNYHAAHREQLNAGRHARYVADIERERAQGREYYATHAEAQRETARRYRETPEGQRAHRAARQRRRARKREATVETFVDTEIFERDNWTCGICREAIDPALSHPDPMSASLDHIVPLAQGGSHERSNVQASHLVCNLRKGARPLEEVAA